MKKHHRAFDKRGVLAMRADLWGMLFGVAEEPEPFELRGNAAIVTIEGPLTHHAEWFWDSYDAIKERFQGALASSAEVVVLRIDSPGGDVAGCFEAVREMRSAAAKAGKRVVAYTDGMAASAGYALACVGEEIVLSATGFVGSIGVISTLVDTVALDQKIGLNFAVIASGEKKRYGHPNVALSDEAIANTQEQVDGLAELFFALVAESRGVPPATIGSLEAGMLFGADAVNAKLADHVCTFDALLESLSSGNTAPLGAAAEETMGWKDAMQKAADEGDEEAKTCLAAMEEDGEKEKKDDSAEEEKTDDKAEEEAPPSSKPKPAEEEPKKDDEKAAARGRHLRPVASVESRLSAIEDRDERDHLLASRPDIMRDPALRKKMLTAPLEAVRWNVENLPRVAAAKVAAPPSPTKTSPLAHAGAAVPGVTRAAGEGGESNGITRASEHADELDAQMGIRRASNAIRHEGTRLILGVMTPTEARAELARRAASAQKGTV